MKKVPFKLAFIFAVFVSFACLSCKTDSESDDSYIENPDANKDADKDNENASSTPTPPAKPKPKAKIRVQSKSLYEIYIYSDSERQNLVVQIPANGSTVFETEQIGEAIFYYTFLISPENDSGITIPFYDNNCAFLLATNADEVAEQTISSPKSISLSSCFVVLKNESEKSIQLMNESFVVSPYKTASTTSPIINPKKSACYVIEKNNFSNIGSYSVREALGTSSLPLKSIIADFEGCKIYTVVYDGKAIKLAAEIGQEELIGMKAYSVTHKCERLDSEEYETSETETVYGFPEEMTEATPKEYEGFEAEDVEQQEIAGDGSTNIEIRYKRIRTTLTFNANGGTFDDGSETKTLNGKYGAEVEMPTPSLDDHRFLGYDAEIPRTFGVEDMAFNAEWEFYSTKETTDSSVYDVITSCKNPLYTYTIKLKGYITESTLQKVAKALYDNSTVSFVFDMSEAFGITELKSYSFNYYERLGCSNLLKVILNNEIKTIGEDAFYKCTGLKSIEIPNSVTSIGNGAFAYCTNLESVSIPDSVTEMGSTVFYDCTNLVAANIGNGVKSIGYNAFEGCTNLQSVTIPNSVTSIGNYAFENCTSLTSVTIPDSVTEIEYAVFSGCASLEEMTLPFVGIGSALFGYIFGSSSYKGGVYVNQNGTGYYIPSSLKKVTVTGGKIVDYAFYDCSMLESVVISNKVTSVGKVAFYKCTGLKSIEIPNSLTSIGNGAFNCCTNLESVTIPCGVTAIGPLTFHDCTNLVAANISNGVKSIGYSAFEGCTSLTSVTISDSVTSIGNYAFENCKSLTNVTIPDSVTEIGYDVFSGCASLVSVTLPNSITSIGSSMFEDCTSLESIVIPESVDYIYSTAFKGCTRVTSVTIFATKPPYVDSSIYGGFSDANINKIYVPAEAVDAYKAASGWKEYADKIFAIEEE